MLTNCKDCKFNNGEACAVSPNYFETFTLLGNSSQEIREKIARHVEPCHEFEISPDLDEITIAITLSVRDWKKIANSSQTSERGRNLRKQVQDKLDSLITPAEREQLSEDSPL